MATHGILSIWLAEIGRRVREGETRISLKEVEAGTGARMEPRIDAYRLWGNVWEYIQDSGLVTRVHHSVEEDEDSFVDVQLSHKGSEAEVWSI
jgi:hypothetical protein